MLPVCGDSIPEILGGCSSFPCHLLSLSRSFLHLPDDHSRFRVFNPTGSIGCRVHHFFIFPCYSQCRIRIVPRSPMQRGSATMNVSIIIPTRNEQENIAPLLDRLGNTVSKSPTSCEIIFVDDSSTDETRSAINAYQGPLPVRLVCRDNETGLASAVCAGAHVAEGDLLVVMDADLSHPPEAIPALLQPLLDGSHDMVIGSRYVQGGSTPGWPALRRAASRLATLPARLFTAVHDPLAGFFAIRKESLLAVRQPAGGFKIGLQILAASDPPLRTTEVPVTFVDRNRGASKMNAGVIGAYLRQLAALGGLDFHALSAGRTLLLAGIVFVLDFLLFQHLSGKRITIDIVHITSFLAACNLGYVLTATTSATSARYLCARSFLRFQFVLILFLFVRGGLVALLIARFSESASIVPLAAAAISIPAATTAYLFAAGGESRFQHNWRAVALLIVLYTIFLRLLYLGSYELIQEEAYYWNYSQHLAMGYLDHPPMVALLIWLGTHLFGPTEFAVRLGAFSCWLVTAFFVHRLTAAMFGKHAALNALVLVAALPFYFGVAVVITPDSPLVACWAGALYYLHKALVQGNARAWLGAGVFLGLGLASKYTIALLGPAVLLFMLIDRSSRHWFRRPQPYLAALIAVALFSPVILWNYQHGWVSFLFQSQHRILDVFHFSTPELAATILLLLTPTGLLAIWVATRRYFLEAIEPSAPLALHRNWLFTLCMALTPLTVFVAFSLSKEVKLNWTGPLWLAFLPLMAASLRHHGNGTGRKLPALLSRLWPPTLAILIVGYGFTLHYFSLGLPGIPFAAGTFLFGGSDLAGKIEQTVRRLEVGRGRPPV
ncbi:MAG: glycosyltransferase, partial [Desulfobulbaceae bacterium]